MVAAIGIFLSGTPHRKVRSSLLSTEIGEGFVIVFRYFANLSFKQYHAAVRRGYMAHRAHQGVSLVDCKMTADSAMVRGKNGSPYPRSINTSPRFGVCIPSARETTRVTRKRHDFVWALRLVSSCVLNSGNCELPVSSRTKHRSAQSNISSRQAQSAPICPKPAV